MRCPRCQRNAIPECASPEDERRAMAGLPAKGVLWCPTCGEQPLPFETATTACLRSRIDERGNDLRAPLLYVPAAEQGRLAI